MKGVREGAGDALRDGADGEEEEVERLLRVGRVEPEREGERHDGEKGVVGDGRGGAGRGEAVAPEGGVEDGLGRDDDRAVERVLRGEPGGEGIGGLERAGGTDELERAVARGDEAGLSRCGEIARGGGGNEGHRLDPRAPASEGVEEPPPGWREGGCLGEEAQLGDVRGAEREGRFDGEQAVDGTGKSVARDARREPRDAERRGPLLRASPG